MISVITGAPGPGKTTYVENNSRPGDVIIDMDKIATALWIPTTDESHSYPEPIRAIAREARNAAVKAAIQMSQISNGLNVWVIHANPSGEMLRRYRAVNAQFVNLDPGIAICIERVKKRNPTAYPRIVSFIREFYQSRVR